MSFISYIDIQDNTHYVNINDIICIGQKCGDLILITKHFTANIPMHADNDIYYDIVKKIKNEKKNLINKEFKEIKYYFNELDARLERLSCIYVDMNMVIHCCKELRKDGKPNIVHAYNNIYTLYKFYYYNPFSQTTYTEMMYQTEDYIKKIFNGF